MLEWAFQIDGSRVCLSDVATERFARAVISQYRLDPKENTLASLMASEDPVTRGKSLKKLAEAYNEKEQAALYAAIESGQHRPFPTAVVETGTSPEAAVQSATSIQQVLTDASLGSLVNQVAIQQNLPHEQAARDRGAKLLDEYTAMTDKLEGWNKVEAVWEAGIQETERCARVVARSQSASAPASLTLLTSEMLRSMCSSAKPRAQAIV